MSSSSPEPDFIIRLIITIPRWDTRYFTHTQSLTDVMLIMPIHTEGWHTMHPTIRIQGYMHGVPLHMVRMEAQQPDRHTTLKQALMPDALLFLCLTVAGQQHRPTILTPGQAVLLVRVPTPMPNGDQVQSTMEKDNQLQQDM